jgi:hypothetical protein
MDVCKMNTHKQFEQHTRRAMLTTSSIRVTAYSPTDFVFVNGDPKNVVSSGFGIVLSYIFLSVASGLTASPIYGNNNQMP